MIRYVIVSVVSGIIKGGCFAFITWFFRVAMYSASQWMKFNLPVGASIYSLVAGLGEMMILGMLYGLVLKPKN